MRARDLSMLGLAFAIIAIFALVVFGLPRALTDKQWVVNWIEVQGSFERVSIEQIRAAAIPTLGNSFVATDLDAVRDHVQSLPWVRSAGVRRKWPDTLQIRVIEHIPSAHWGQRMLISELGNVFEVEGTIGLSGLPQLDGPAGRHAEVLETYREIDIMLQHHGQSIESLTLSNRGSWTTSLNSGMTIELGSKSPIERLGRFLDAESLISYDGARRIGTVDLRYTNGFSIRWVDMEQSQELSMSDEEVR